MLSLQKSLKVLAWMLLLSSASLRAEVVRIEVSTRADVASPSFGSVGAYEELTGRIFFEVDPKNSANRIVADIDKAPRNAAGKVEFSSNFRLLKPKDIARANGALLFEVSNRGNQGLLRTFNRALTEPQWGDGFLMRQGFTLFWAGWQFDVPEKPGALRIEIPVAHEADGSTIRGLVRSDAANKGGTLQLADRYHKAYPVANANDPANILTVRDCIECERRTVPRSQWKFDEGGRSISITNGELRKIYELVYVSQDPPLAGLGFAAVRDALSKLKYDAVPEFSLPHKTLRRALGFGVSQSGRFLRSYLYYGFNEDEKHRKVMDGVMAHVAGAGRGSFNQRFAQPSRDGHPYSNFFYPSDVFPFTDTPQTDPQTGQRGSLMARTPQKFAPKIFYTNASYEYWGRCASLIHTSVDGKTDAALPSNVRIYHFTGGKHDWSGKPVASETQQQLINPLDYSWGLRKLLLAMNAWTAESTPPPQSAYPRIDDGTLVTPQALKFPQLPQVNPPGMPRQAYRVNYGPDFWTQGIATLEPPKIGAAYAVMVPQVDADGNELDGVRMPELAVPLATYTGWALQPEASGAGNVLALGVGSFIPFPRTPAERERTHDPRRSLEERYRSREHYQGLIAESARRQARRGYLLDADIPAIVEQAGERWDAVH